MSKNKFNSAELPPLERYSSRKEWEAACWEQLLRAPELIKILASSRERQSLVAKAYGLQGLLSGKTYQAIGEEAWLSPQTISSIRKALQAKEYRSYPEQKSMEPKKQKTSFPRSIPKERKYRTKYGTISVPF